MCFLKVESDCCMWVWLCVWVNPCISEGCSLMWQVQTAAGPLARPKAPLQFIRNEADLNAGRCLLLSLQTEEARPSNSGKAEAEPRAGPCFSCRSCVNLCVLCRGFICARAVGNAAARWAKCVCSTLDARATPKQPVWQPAQEIPYSSLFGMQICLPEIQKLQH